MMSESECGCLRQKLEGQKIQEPLLVYSTTHGRSSMYWRNKYRGRNNARSKVKAANHIQ
jgi:hypothetical protein